METLFEEIQQHSWTALKKFILSFLDQFELVTVNRDWQAIDLCKEPANGLRLSLRVAIIVIPLHSFVGIMFILQIGAIHMVGGLKDNGHRTAGL